MRMHILKYMISHRMNISGLHMLSCDSFKTMVSGEAYGADKNNLKLQKNIEENNKNRSNTRKLSLQFNLSGAMAPPNRVHLPCIVFSSYLRCFLYVCDLCVHPSMARRWRLGRPDWTVARSPLCGLSWNRELQSVV
jgi:hypothetical protein